jgi:Fe-S-cluster containining protein
MNKCGDCNACCKVAAIEELDKPAGVLCKYYDNGCTIYDTRPEACRNFQCLYLQQSIPEKYRPDNVGVMFEKPPGFLFWVGIETEKGSIHKQECINVVKALEKDGSVCALEGLDGKNYHHLLPGMTEADFDRMVETTRKNVGM